METNCYFYFTDTRIYESFSQITAVLSNSRFKKQNKCFMIDLLQNLVLCLYLLFAVGLGRKRSSAKDFRRSLLIDFKGKKMIFDP